jgi:hypothetical protein
MPSKEELNQIWEDAFELGYNNSELSRFALWDSESQKWDNIEIIGTWIEPTWKEIDHMQRSVFYINRIAKDHPEYVAWYVGSRPTRIRVSTEDGGLELPPTTRALAEIAFSLGGIGSFRVTARAGIAPPLENYIDLNLQSD